MKNVLLQKYRFTVGLDVVRILAVGFQCCFIALDACTGVGKYKDVYARRIPVRF